MRARIHIKSHPLHPILVAFPIGLWTASLVFDLIGLAAGNNLLWAAGFYCIIGGCIMAALAAVPGVIDLFTVVPPNSSGRTRGYIHGSLNSLALLLAAVEGQRIVVGRCGEGVFAFADHCTHKGGPLSDGALVGCTVQCPWHGSQFDVTTGRVVSGPAERKIVTYDTETRNGEIFIKKPERGGQKKAA